MAVAILAEAQSAGRTLLNEVESKAVLAEIGVPVTPTKLAQNADQAATLAADLGFPVALKIVAEAVTHKSDVGGVELNLVDAADVRMAYERITTAVTVAVPGAEVQGISVQPMAKAGTEVIMGLTRDPQFGPVLMFGLGGVLVEVLKDVAFRVVPLEPRDAAEMVREIKGFPVLDGYRGAPPADLAALEEVLMTLSAFAEAHPEIAELDLNPVFAYDDGAVAVDARIVLV